MTKNLSVQNDSPTMNIVFSILSGTEVSQEDLDTINLLRKRELNSKEAITPNPSNQYFFAKDSENKILAFAILRPAQIEFRGQVFSVFEFVSLIAEEKGKGYGSFLLSKLITYSNSKGKTLIGFCLSDLVPFYVKNGLEMFPDGPDRISFKEDSRSFPGETPGVAFFAPGADGLIDEMKKYPEEIALIVRPRKN